MREELRHAAELSGRRFLEWTPDGASVYNPFGRGSETEIADKALAGERFTEPHYQRQAQRYMGHLVRALRSLDIEVSLRSIVQHLDPRHRSLMADILQRRTALQVVEAAEGDQLQPATAYFAPPDVHLLVTSAGRVNLSQMCCVRGPAEVPLPGP